VPVRPKLSLDNPPPACRPEGEPEFAAHFVSNARRAARLKRQHTQLKRSGAPRRL